MGDDDLRTAALEEENERLRASLAAADAAAARAEELAWESGEELKRLRGVACEHRDRADNAAAENERLRARVAELDEATAKWKEAAAKWEEGIRLLTRKIIEQQEDLNALWAHLGFALPRRPKGSRPS